MFHDFDQTLIVSDDSWPRPVDLLSDLRLLIGNEKRVFAPFHFLRSWTKAEGDAIYPTIRARSVLNPILNLKSQI
jgi:hypothetical protein